MAQRRPAHHNRRNPSVDIPKYQPQTHMDAEAQAAHERQRALAQISDYDSENAGYGSDLPMKPPPPQRTTEELNLSVVQRHHPDVTSILSIAPYAVIYEFETIPEPVWEKKDIEGSLFICQLRPGSYGEDRYAAIVLNRRGLKNFDAPLIEVENGGVEINDPYVIITFIEEGRQRIYGVFIFSEGPGSSTEHSRILNGELMITLANSAGISRKAAEASAADAQARHTNGHVQEAERELEQDPTMGGEPMGREISLQQLFGQQRTRDAGYSVRTHHIDGSTSQATQAGGFETPQNIHPPLPPAPSQQQQTNALMDLFLGAGAPRSAGHHRQVQEPNSMAGAFQASAGQQFYQHIPQHAQVQQQPNVLADLFRRSGLPPQ
ncbi:uncharacterized protein HMPREF1541_04932 [Cyphellophora europaea CBS 101466]|uniref:PH domain-like protein n=1 Tax=Cyphellophora europaea (strain CBS 101466) TaxID=1220924 RepID=W2RXY9_CYPE1|nr:uncharacterized protein HMPREF1541_04932 [Cyphellophora europaea CBS 101466]ETN40653.1 hypothetical protein HMPREF1541_04932 [Cyphellophora europaea CBS 101466]